MSELDVKELRRIPRSGLTWISPEQWDAILAALERIPELKANNQRLQQSLAFHERSDKVTVDPEHYSELKDRAERAEWAEAALDELAASVNQWWGARHKGYGRELSEAGARMGDALKVAKKLRKERAALAATPDAGDAGALAVRMYGPALTKLAQSDAKVSSTGQPEVAAPGEEGAE